MTTTLHLPADPNAPIACDMTTAADTLGERLAEYDALVERELRTASLVLRLAPEARARVEDLARREARCCPFLDYRVETAGDDVVWTVTGPPAFASALIRAGVSSSASAKNPPTTSSS